MAKNLIPGHGAPGNNSNPGFHVCSLDSVSYDKGGGGSENEIPCILHLEEHASS